MTRESWRLSRRDVLRGGGLSLALPLLQGMNSVARASCVARPKRMVVTYFSYGAFMPGSRDGQPIAGQEHDAWNWWPCAEPGELTFNESSAPFAGLKDSVSYLRGLDHAGGYGLGGHSSGDVFATGADMSVSEKTNNISIDQYAARVNGHLTRYPSLVLGTEGGTGSYGQAKTLSHYGPGRPIPALHRTQEIFNRLFRPYSNESIERIRARLAREASVLDLVGEHATSYRNRLGVDDRRKLDEYLESVRSIEQRTERTTRWTHEPLPEVESSSLNLDAQYEDPLEYTRCMYDLVFLALQTDATRYVTFMLESEQSTSNEVGKFANTVLKYNGQTHDIAHKRPAESGLWDRWRAEQHAYFLQRLRDTTEDDGNLLDHTVVVWGSAHPHSSHSTRNYPIQVAGGGGLGLRHGKLHAFEGERKVPLANLFVTLLNAIDAPADSFADSTSDMSELRG